MIVTKSKVPSIPIPELRGSIKHITYPAFAELKLDGEFNFLVYTPKLCFLINKYGTVRKNFPALNDIEKILKNNVGTDVGHDKGSCMLVCEVYWDKGKLHDIYKLNSHKKDDDTKIAVFDVVSWNGDLRREVLVDRLEGLHALGLSDYTPESKVVLNEVELEQFFEQMVKDGYEGIVAKPLDGIFPAGPCPWAKVKFKDQNDCAVTLVDTSKERIEIISVSVDPTSGKPRMIPVGVKAPNKYKKHIKVGEVVTIEHQGVLESGSLRHPVLIPKGEWK